MESFFLFAIFILEISFLFRDSCSLFFGSYPTILLFFFTKFIFLLFDFTSTLRFLSERVLLLGIYFFLVVFLVEIILLLLFESTLLNLCS